MNGSKRLLTKKSDKRENKKIRLHVFMAQCGIGSRRKCEEYIREAKVKVNGNVISIPGCKVSRTDNVEFNNQRIHLVEKKIYIALHKPILYLCSNKDTLNRSLAKEFFKDKIKERLFNVGRLDYLSSGLIFFTNDGDFTYRITHPSFEIEKEYLVKTRNKIFESKLNKYMHGIRINENVYTLKTYQLLTPYKVKLTIVEGKNKEIREVFKYFDLEIIRIHRIRIGIVQLKSLKPGHFRHLSQKEIEWFLSITH